jgi:exodeoxyribonuclease-5
MVHAKVVKDLRDRGWKLLWVGDYGQLPPVKGGQTDVLRKNAYVLRQIHRQAAESPIIQLAHNIRKGARITDKQSGIRYVKAVNGTRDVCKEFIENKIDRLIVRENIQRIRFNDAVRMLKGYTSIIDVGDEIICLKNDRSANVLNGQIFTVDQIHRSLKDSYLLKLTSHDSGYSQVLYVSKSQFGNPLKTENEDTDDLLFDYAYAITGHKSQGSSWGHVGVAVKGFVQDERAWNYTAVTRAENELTIFC